MKRDYQARAEEGRTENLKTPPAKRGRTQSLVAPKTLPYMIPPTDNSSPLYYLADQAPNLVSRIAYFLQFKDILNLDLTCKKLHAIIGKNDSKNYIADDVNTEMIATRLQQEFFDPITRILLACEGLPQCYAYNRPVNALQLITRLYDKGERISKSTFDFLCSHISKDFSSLTDVQEKNLSVLQCLPEKEGWLCQPWRIFANHSQYQSRLQDIQPLFQFVQAFHKENPNKPIKIDIFYEHELDAELLTQLTNLPIVSACFKWCTFKDGIAPLCCLNQLRELTLEQCTIQGTLFPAELCVALNNLIILNLNNCEHTNPSLPAEFKKLVHLRHLGLRGTEVIFPAEIAQVREQLKSITLNDFNVPLEPYCISTKTFRPSAPLTKLVTLQVDELHDENLKIVPLLKRLIVNCNKDGLKNFVNSLGIMKCLQHVTFNVIRAISWHHLEVLGNTTRNVSYEFIDREFAWLNSRTFKLSSEEIKNIVALRYLVKTYRELIPMLRDFITLYIKHPFVEQVLQKYPDFTDALQYYAEHSKLMEDLFKTLTHRLCKINELNTLRIKSIPSCQKLSSVLPVLKNNLPIVAQTLSGIKKATIFGIYLVQECIEPTQNTELSPELAFTMRRLAQQINNNFNTQQQSFEHIVMPYLSAILSKYEITNNLQACQIQCKVLSDHYLNALMEAGFRCQQMETIKKAIILGANAVHRTQQVFLHDNAPSLDQYCCDMKSENLGYNDLPVKTRILDSALIMLWIYAAPPLKSNTRKESILDIITFLVEHGANPFEYAPDNRLVLERIFGGFDDAERWDLIVNRLCGSRGILHDIVQLNAYVKRHKDKIFRIKEFIEKKRLESFENGYSEYISTNNIQNIAQKFDSYILGAHNFLNIDIVNILIHKEILTLQELRQIAQILPALQFLFYNLEAISRRICA